MFVSSLNLPPLTCFSDLEALSLNQPACYLQLLLLFNESGWIPEDFLFHVPKSSSGSSREETSCKDLVERDSVTLPEPAHVTGVTHDLSWD